MSTNHVVGQKARIAKRDAAESVNALSGGLGQQTVGIDAEAMGNAIAQNNAFLLAQMERMLSAIGGNVKPDNQPLPAVSAVIPAAPSALPPADTIVGETEEQSLRRKLAEIESARSKRVESESASGGLVQTKGAAPTVCDYSELPPINNHSYKFDYEQKIRGSDETEIVKKTAKFPPHVRGWLAEYAPKELLCKIINPVTGESMGQVMLELGENPVGGQRYGCQGGEINVPVSQGDGRWASVKAKATGVYFVFDTFQRRDGTADLSANRAPCPESMKRGK